MHTRLLLLPAAAFLISTTLAQTNPGGPVLECAPLSTPERTGNENWGRVAGPHSGYATLRYTHTEPQPGASTTTLLLAHTTLDPAVSTPDMINAIVALYPFLAAPASTWNSTHAAFNGLQAMLQGPAQLAIPPDRVAAHINRLLASGSFPDETFGPTAFGSQIGFVAPSWPTELDDADERRSWREGWHGERDIIQTNLLGRNAVGVAASFMIPGINLDGLPELQQTLDADYGFLIHVQAVHVTRIPSSPVPVTTIQFSQSVVISCTSLKVQAGDEWMAAYGPIPIFPSVLGGDHKVHAVLCGGWLVVPFPPEAGYMTDLRAYVQLQSGQWQVVPRVLNVPDTLGPNIARFPFPVDGISQVMFFDRASNPLVTVKPLYRYGQTDGVSVFARAQGPI